MRQKTLWAGLSLIACVAGAAHAQQKQEPLPGGSSGSLIGSATAQKKLSYDTRKAFAPVTQLTTLATC